MAVTGLAKLGNSTVARSRMSQYILDAYGQIDANRQKRTLCSQENRRSSMLNEDKEDERSYKVVINHEEQYSIWLHEKANPSGWRDEGTVGKKAECLRRIDEVWTDMRPL